MVELVYIRSELSLEKKLNKISVSNCNYINYSCVLKDDQHNTNLKRDITRNSPGDEIANVNFHYDDIVHDQPQKIFITLF